MSSAIILLPHCEALRMAYKFMCVCFGLVQATATGPKEQEAINFLEKQIKADTSLNADQTVQLAISALQVRVKRYFALATGNKV